jgi:hypothetical protein
VRPCTGTKAVWPIGGVEVQLNPFLTTALEGGEGSVSCPGRSLPPGKTRYPLYRWVYGRGTQSLLEAGSRAARRKVTASGVPNYLNYCEMFIV